MIKIRRALTIVLASYMAVSLIACSKSDEVPTLPQDPIPDSTYSTEAEEVIVHGGNEESKIVQIQMTDENILVDSIEASTEFDDVFITKDATNSFQIVNITKAGDYEISGHLSNGQIAIDLGEAAQNDEKATVNIYLNNVTLTNNTTSCIVFKNVYHNKETENMGANLYIASGSVNNISLICEDNLSEYAIYSYGALTIDSYFGKSGVLNIDSKSKGVGAYNTLNINGSNINITSTQKCIGTEAESLATLTINGGSINVKTKNTGSVSHSIDSTGWIVINGGKVLAQSQSGFGLNANEKIRINGGTIQATGATFDAEIESYPLYAVFEFEELCEAGTYILKTNEGITVLPCMTEVDFSYLLITGDKIQTGEYILSGSFGTEYLANAKGFDEEDFAPSFIVNEDNNHFVMQIAS